MNVENTNNIPVEVDTTTAADIESKPMKWLLNPYLPIGAVTVLLGDGGYGKSFATLAIAAAISRGQLLPGMETPFPASDIIIANAENPWPSVIKPRLEMLGADCTRIHRINDAEKRLTLTDERIEAAIRKHNAAFVVLNPLQSYLDVNFSMNRAESIRPAFTHLERVAERTNSAILIVGHISKGRGKAQHRGLGSVDIVNAVPSVLMLGKAVGLEADERVIAHLKSNFAEIGSSQMFRLNKADGFQWLGESDITPDEIVSFNSKKSRADTNRLEEAIEFLTDLLSEKGEVPAIEAIELAEAAGISKRTLDRARKSAGVKATRADDCWVWSL